MIQLQKLESDVTKADSLIVVLTAALSVYNSFMANDCPKAHLFRPTWYKCLSMQEK